MSMTDAHESVPIPFYGRVSIPAGWTLEPLSVVGTHLLQGPNRLMATVDFGHRTVRSGMTWSGPVVGDDRAPRFRGRGWAQRLVDLAVQHLTEIAR